MLVDALLVIGLPHLLHLHLSPDFRLHPQVDLFVFAPRFAGGVAEACCAWRNIRQHPPSGVCAPSVAGVPFGYKRLHAFDQKLASVYADVEGRSTWAIKALLIAIFVISCLSMLANALGRHYFGQSNWALVPIAVAFSVLQYTLCYIGYTRNFTIEQFMSDAPDDDGQAVETTTEDPKEIGKRSNR